jgi:amidophosphoribosyltransferase
MTPEEFSLHPFEDDRLHEECGVFGIIGTQDASAHAALGLHALQHRGQEAAGVVSTNGKQFSQHMALGKVGDNFNNESVIKHLEGYAAIGHVRYSTSGEKTNIANIQPLFAELDFGGFALAHNGNLTNAKTLKKILVRHGSIFRTTMDTEVMLHLIALSEGETIVDCLIDTLRQVEGAYSLVALTRDAVIGARDPLGVRPLVLGKLGNAYVLASETCALDIIGAQFVRDIEAGEIVIISEDSIQSIHPFKKKKERFCIFEYVYFARPDSRIEGREVYHMRKAMGRQLAVESKVPADVVVPVPDSGVPAALGFAEKSGIPFELGIIRNHYVGRTFIEPTEQVRHFGVRLKHNANPAVISGKRVILIDDSIVRGTTSKKIVQMVRDAGAKEVHMRISSPPTTHSCFYGVDTPSQDKLLAHRMSIKEMADFIGVESLAFLEVDGLYKAVGEVKRNKDMPQFCDACFTGDYPISITDNEGAPQSLPLLEQAAKTKTKKR